MTKNEIGDLIEALPQELDTDEFIYRLVNWAVNPDHVQKSAQTAEFCTRNGLA